MYSDLDNQILSPVDAFILEYRSKILEDQKKLQEKINKSKNVSGPGTSAMKKVQTPVSNAKPGYLQSASTILVTDCSNKENQSKVSLL